MGFVAIRRFRSQPEQHREACAPARFAPDIDDAALAFYQIGHDGQTHPHTSFGRAAAVRASMPTPESCTTNFVQHRARPSPARTGGLEVTLSGCDRVTPR